MGTRTLWTSVRDLSRIPWVQEIRRDRSNPGAKLARRVRLTARYLSDARRLGVVGGTHESRDVKRVINALETANAESLEADIPIYAGSSAWAIARSRKQSRAGANRR